MPFCIVSENSFAATGYEKCKEYLPTLAAICHEFYAACLSEYGDTCGSVEDLGCDTAPQCLYRDGTACKHAQLLIIRPSYWGGGNIPFWGDIYETDENCIEPNPDETPPDPLVDQLNDVSAPNECRGE